MRIVGGSIAGVAAAFLLAWAVRMIDAHRGVPKIQIASDADAVTSATDRAGAATGIGVSQVPRMDILGASRNGSVQSPHGSVTR
jgi:hypothetical protein